MAGDRAKSRRRAYSDQRAADIGGGVWSVPVPIPGNPLGYTLVYAIESPGGPVLVDAGWNHPDAWQALRDGLAGVGIDVADVRGVVVTHYHPDHSGLAGQVRENSGAWIAMHEADIALVKLFRDVVGDGTHRDFQADQLRRAGAGSHEVDAAVTFRPEPPALPDLALTDGDLIDLPGRRLRTIWTPGHSPGHICLHLEDADRLFTGDHVLPDITPHIGIYPYDRDDIDPLGDFMASLRRVMELGAIEALPAHEIRFADVAARAAEIHAHHQEKLRDLRALMAESPGPRTIWEIASLMTWNRPWDQLAPMLRGMAAGEAAAHLRALEVSELIRRTADEPVRFVIHS
ncbi:MBL fold hydrolase [Acrocarpospora phusangensis]|uniref:MBL fold hydrolase n=1 Tax=Acrocarpospora phusangensis TaxID=1070424 RepID=A0A919QDZ6_9ACTN|nr:MBL fold metallo-hydrolase [Acrocarpospora phusangensis]GIH24820.1 MBL fold hydrolase [Acrocarpospora phusangensis]